MPTWLHLTLTEDNRSGLVIDMGNQFELKGTGCCIGIVTDRGRNHQEQILIAAVFGNCDIVSLDAAFLLIFEKKTSFAASRITDDPQHEMKIGSCNSAPNLSAICAILTEIQNHRLLENLLPSGT